MARVLPYQVDSLQPLQCIVISHWFLQSLLPLIHLVEKWPLIAAAHLLSYICLFILQNVLNQLLVDSGRLLFSTEWNRDYLVQVCFFVVIFSTLFFLQTVWLHWALNEFHSYCSKIETLWSRSAIFDLCLLVFRMFPLVQCLNSIGHLFLFLLE